jgi:hypothetical protein
MQQQTSSACATADVSVTAAARQNSKVIRSVILFGFLGCLMHLEHH